MFLNLILYTKANKLCQHFELDTPSQYLLSIYYFISPGKLCFVSDCRYSSWDVEAQRIRRTKLCLITSVGSAFHQEGQLIGSILATPFDSVIPDCIYRLLVCANNGTTSLRLLLTPSSPESATRRPIVSTRVPSIDYLHTKGLAMLDCLQVSPSWLDLGLFPQHHFQAIRRNQGVLSLGFL